jgi:HK97 gp10 family phage protein
MGFAIVATVQGIEPIVGKLSSLPGKIQKKTLRKAINAGLAAPLKAAKANARRVGVTGLTAKAIGRKVKVYRGSGTVVGLIGPRSGFGVVAGVRTRGKSKGKEFRRDPFYTAHLAEFGTRRSRATPFMRPAYDSTKEQSKTAVIDTLQQGIAEAMS